MKIDSLTGRKMKIKIILTLFSLLLYPCIALSVDSRVLSGIEHKLINIKNANETGKRQFIARTKIADIRRVMDYKIVKNRSYNQFDNKSKYEINNDCNSSSASNGCASSNLVSMGTTSSYIDEYSVFAVIGTGIKLPEEQIESFNGIDD
jgi:hypothetical protein